MAIRVATACLAGFVAPWAIPSLADEIPPSPSTPAPEAFWPSEFEYVPPRPKPPYTAPFQLRGIIPKSGSASVKVN